MNTPIQNLQKSIAHLETTGRTGRLLDDLKKQLEDWQNAGTKSTQELYFSGRPMVSQAKKGR